MEEDGGPDIWLFVGTATAVFVVLYLLRQWIKGTQFTEKVSAKGKIAAVTGASAGIGQQLVRELNLRGVKVYMLCRDVEKGRQAASELFSRVSATSVSSTTGYTGDHTRLRLPYRAGVRSVPFLYLDARIVFRTAYRILRVLRHGVRYDAGPVRPFVPYRTGAVQSMVRHPSLAEKMHLYAKTT